MENYFKNTPKPVYWVFSRVFLDFNSFAMSGIFYFMKYREN